MKYLILVLLIGLWWPVTSALAAAAASDDVSLRVLVGEDTIAPSTPVILSVVPIAPTQIDIAWLAATDNLAVAGYVVVRDGNSIATTTLSTLSLNDAGLNPETLYSYTVVAFDAAGNISSSSVAVATTTLALPPPPATTTPVVATPSQASATALPVRLDTISLTTEQTGARLALTTVRPARFTVRWGTTPEYERETIQTEVFSDWYRYEWSGLSPATQYFIEITGVNARGVAEVLYAGSFYTKSIIPETSIPNVRAFQAVAEIDGGVALSWQLPADMMPGAVVRVVRSERRFPTHPEDGVLVYQGSNLTTRDVDIDWLNNLRVFYGIFVLLPSGQTSSGAVLEVRQFTASVPPREEPVVPPINATASVEFITPDAKLPGLAEVSFLHGGTEYRFTDEQVTLPPGEPVLVRVPVSSVAPHLKSLVVHFYQTGTNVSSYILLRLDESGEWYEGLLETPEGLGTWRLQLTVYDYEAETVARYQTPITIAASGTAIGAGTAPTTRWVPWLYALGQWALWILLLLFAWRLIAHLFTQVRINEPQSHR